MEHRDGAGTRAPETSQTLDRGLRLLELVASAPAGYSISELSEHLRLNRTVVYRLVATLEQHGLARRGAGGRITAGLGLFRLGQSVQPVLQAKATPVLRALADEVGATAHLTIAEGDEATAVAVVEPRWTDFHVAYRVGARHHVREAAAGKAIELGRSTA
ncbi:MAG: IclR family transcriptional regulator, partial [Nocardioidaceae bacterium]